MLKFFEDPTRFLNISIIGLTNGAIYGLVALGYTLVYGILQLINFAHGDVFALSGLVASTLIISVFDLNTETGVFLVVVGLLATLAVTMPVFALFNATIERIAYKPLRNAPRLAPLITAVGVSFIVQNISLGLYGVDFESVPNFIPRTDAIRIGDVAIQWDNIAVFLIVIPVLVILTWFVRSTRQGKAMRAVAQDTEASAMMGINVNRTISVTFFLAGSLAAVAGLVYLLQFNIRYDTGFQLGLIAFTAAVLGGIGNLTRRRPRGADDRPRRGVQRRASTARRAVTGRGRSSSGSSSPRSCSDRRASSASGRPRGPDVSEAARQPSRSARAADKSWWAAGALILIGVLYPLIVDSLQEVPLIGDFMPGVGSVVVMLIFTMMALGLNVVVGYAGLLDLGYVAFYAAGAYVAGWFASLHFDQVTFHLSGAVVRRPSRHPSLHVARARPRRRLHHDRRHRHRAPDAPASR